MNFVHGLTGFRSMPPFHIFPRRFDCPAGFVDPKNGQQGSLAKPTAEFFKL